MIVIGMGECKMFAKNPAKIIYKIEKRGTFMNEQSFLSWSAPAIGFSYDRSMDTALLDMIERQILKESETKDSVICYLSDWTNIAEGIIFTQSTIYVHTPKNVNNFCCMYSSIRHVISVNAKNKQALQIHDVEGNVYVINSHMFRLDNIKTYLNKVKSARPSWIIKLLATGDVIRRGGVIPYTWARGMISKYYADNSHLHGPRGHGQLAEYANHFWDILNFMKPEHVGGNNARNGPDRIVNGVLIQTKYCASGDACIDSCFEGKNYRYWGPDNKPMQVEVPADMHPQALEAMARHIRKGHVQGINDPDVAKDIVRKGAFTYDQVLLISKAGSIEGLAYDAVKGITLSVKAASVTAIITFAVSLWGGKETKQAMEESCYSALNVGGVVLISSIVSAQLGRTVIVRSLRGTTDAIISMIGPDISRLIVRNLFKRAINGAAAMSYLSKIVRGNTIAIFVTGALLSIGDFRRRLAGNISNKQLSKNLISTYATLVLAALAGSACLAAAGSFVPVAGTTIGGIVGFFGVLLGGVGAGVTVDKTLNLFIEDDALEMARIFEDEFCKIAHLNLIGAAEAKEIIIKLSALDLRKKLMEMYASSDRQAFVVRLLTPLVEEVLAKRIKIEFPSYKTFMSYMWQITKKHAVQLK